MSDAADSSDADSLSDIDDKHSSRVKNFIAFKALSVADVRSKFREKAVIKTSEFFCSVDPNPAAFVLQFVFGTTKRPDTLTVKIYSVNEPVYGKSESLTIYDEEAKVLKECQVSYDHPLELRVKRVKRDRFNPDPVCKVRLKDLKDNKLGSWHFHYSMVYQRDSYLDETAMYRGQPSRLQKNLDELFESGQDTDVTFLLQGETINVHKTMLSSRCQYFDDFFRCWMKNEKKKREKKEREEKEKKEKEKKEKEKKEKKEKR